MQRAIEPVEIREIESGAENRSQTLKVVVTEDTEIIKTILSSLGDEEKRTILDVVIDQPKTIFEIFEICGIPQTTAYRKIMALIQDGLLIEDGSSSKHGYKSVPRYAPAFDSIVIKMDKNKTFLQLGIVSRLVPKNSILQRIKNSDLTEAIA
ncbi:MAG: hypothetical protein ACREAD_04675 [Nitrosopumilaceae archaeon]